MQWVTGSFGTKELDLSLINPPERVRINLALLMVYIAGGSLLANGEWHWADVPVVYCAETRAHAVDQ